MKFRTVNLPMADPHNFNDLPAVPDMEIKIPEGLFDDGGKGSLPSSRTVASVLSPKPESKSKNKK